MSSFGGKVRWENWHFALPSFSAKLVIASISPKPANIQPSSPLTMLTALLIDAERNYICPLSVVTSVVNIGILPYRVSLQVGHRLNLTKAS